MLNIEQPHACAACHEQDRDLDQKICLPANVIDRPAYISSGPNPVTSTWYRYLFTTPEFPDYPKYAVWADAYYVSSNENSPAVYAMDRVNMLTGSPATAPIRRTLLCLLPR